MSSEPDKKSSFRPNLKLKSIPLAIASLGIVFGDIGTSPLYAMNEIFFGASLGTGNSQPSPEIVLGCLSLVFWILTLMISVKYLSLVLLADNEGEGGVFALYSRIHKHKKGVKVILKVLLMLSAGLLFGEGIITPAISVLSAVEGITLLAPGFQSWTVPFAIVVLFFLFQIQKRGTHSVGKYFGPVALIWFVTIGTLGFFSILKNPEILLALNPKYALSFLTSESLGHIVILLSSAMLVITGGEALFADMGHFGLSTIRKAWFAIVYPSHLLNYFGQGAHLLGGNPVYNQNLFFSIAPKSLLIPLVVLATLAAIIASQALISGAFSLGSQAIALGLFPRLKIVQTHEAHSGQTYLPFINWTLFFGTATLALVFQTSSRLASAYGLSLSAVMFCTSLAMIAIATEYWRWSLVRAVGIFGTFAAIDFIFMISKGLKFFEGGFIPLLIGFIIFSIMRVWRWGRKSTYKAYSEIETPTLRELVKIKNESTQFIPRNVVLMVPKPLRTLDDKTPVLAKFFINRYGLLPRNLFLVEVVHRKIPFVTEPRCEHITFFKDHAKGNIVSVTIHFGFMEHPNVELVLESLAQTHEIDLPSDPHKWLVHVSHERLIPSKNWNIFQHFRLRLFLIFRQITQPAYFHYGLGQDVNLSLDIMPVRLK